MKLIICGNGFDMHHNLKTGYSEYKKYLQCNVPLLVEKFEKFPWFPGKCKNDLWRDVENTLALNLQEMIEHFKAYYNDPDGVIEYETDFEDWTRFIYSFTGDEFYKWISTTDYNAAKAEDDLAELFSDAVFVTFNYTDTIERIYGVPNEKVLHLHGALSKVAVENCFGQSILPSFTTIEEAESYNGPILESDKWNSDIIREEIQFGAPVVEANSLDSIVEQIQHEDIQCLFRQLIDKTTKSIYKNLPILKAFLHGKEIDEIVIMGHSLMGADDLYYSECLIPLYGTKKWTAYFHTDADYEEKTAFFAKNAITTHQCKKW